MRESQYNEVMGDLIKSLEKDKFISIGTDLGHMGSDMSDLGNLIGNVVGKHIVGLGLEEDDFLSGIIHGLSLTNGKHGK
jgi:hypothetical protein